MADRNGVCPRGADGRRAHDMRKIGSTESCHKCGAMIVSFQDLIKK